MLYIHESLWKSYLGISTAESCRQQPDWCSGTSRAPQDSPEILIGDQRLEAGDCGPDAHYLDPGKGSIVAAEIRLISGMAGDNDGAHCKDSSVTTASRLFGAWVIMADSEPWQIDRRVADGRAKETVRKRETDRGVGAVR